MYLLARKLPRLRFFTFKQTCIRRHPRGLSRFNYRFASQVVVYANVVQVVLQLDCTTFEH
jgi:hypothetical protein